MKYLTNVRWTDIDLMNLLDDRTLCLYSQVNKAINELYKSKEFWTTRIMLLFGKEWMKYIDDGKSWVDNYQFVKMKYCYEYYLPLYESINILETSMPLLVSPWDKETFSLALEIYYNFNYNDIKIMIDEKLWTIFDRLPDNRYYNQIKTDIYFLKKDINKLNHMKSLGYDISVNGIISSYYSNSIDIYFVDHIPIEQI